MALILDQQQQEKFVVKKPSIDTTGRRGVCDLYSVQLSVTPTAEQEENLIDVRRRLFAVPCCQQLLHVWILQERLHGIFFFDFARIFLIAVLHKYVRAL